jgi:hypothetical protein
MNGSRVGVVAVSSWTADSGALVPSLIPTEQRRGASLATRMAAHVLGQLTERSGIDAASLATVFATRYAELGMTRGAPQSGAAAPMHRLVGGLGAGALWGASAPSDRGFSTTVMAGPRTVAMGLLEAMAVLDRTADQVALVCLDEALPESWSSAGGYDALAAGMLLRRTDDASCWLEALGPRMVNAATRSLVPAPVAANPCSPALELVAVMRSGRGGSVVLESDVGGARKPRWCVEVHPERKWT